MHNIILFISAFMLLTACSEPKKSQQVIIPEAQLEALQKAKNIEATLLDAQQQQTEKMKEQGL